jgi:hypothetical protein
MQHLRLGWAGGGGAENRWKGEEARTSLGVSIGDDAVPGLYFCNKRLCMILLCLARAFPFFQPNRQMKKPLRTGELDTPLLVGEGAAPPPGLVGIRSPLIAPGEFNCISPCSEADASHMRKLLDRRDFLLLAADDSHLQLTMLCSCRAQANC